MHMFKRIMVVGSLGCAAGCGAPIDSSTLNIGQVSEALSATTLTNSTYRLNSGVFDVFDNSGNRVATLAPDPNQAELSLELKPGNYRVELRSGWLLQRQVDSGWVDMYASLTAAPVDTFWVHPDETLELLYEFSAGSRTGALTSASPASIDAPSTNGATGTIVLKMSVDDCGLYISKISSLAAFTIDCRGTLDGTQYTLTSGGLSRNFSSCSTGDTTALASIDGILSLQYDRPELEAQYPKAGRDIAINKSYSGECIAKDWNEWHTQFEDGGVNVCPVWQKVSQINPPETGAAAVVGAGLPVAVIDKKTKLGSVAPSSPSLLDMQKLGIAYQVSFPAGSPVPNCGTAAECAVACAGGFKGFVLSSNGVDTVTADPAYWEGSTVYAKDSNPFLINNYYHAMADAGPVPGDQFGHAQRSKAYKDSKGKFVGEPCSYYLNGTRWFTKLLYSPSSNGDVSWCKPPQ